MSLFVWTSYLCLLWNLQNTPHSSKILFFSILCAEFLWDGSDQGNPAVPAVSDCSGRSSSTVYWTTVQAAVDTHFWAGQCCQQQSLAFFFFFCVPQLYLWGSPLLGEIFAYVSVFNPTIKVVTFRLCGWCVLGVFFVAGIYPSRTWTSGSFECVRLNACVHRLDLGLYSHSKEFLGEWSLKAVHSKQRSCSVLLFECIFLFLTFFRFCSHRGGVFLKWSVRVRAAGHSVQDENWAQQT